MHSFLSEKLSEVRRDKPASAWVRVDSSEILPEARPETGQEAASWGLKERVLRMLKRGWHLVWGQRKTVTISKYDPVFEGVYLGNVAVGGAASGPGCAEAPLLKLWSNFTTDHGWEAGQFIEVTVTAMGLRVKIRGRGTFEYWAHRITHCQAPAAYPKLFCWMYRHEGRNMQQQIRCHAVKCADERTARRMSHVLSTRLALAFGDFRRYVNRRQRARMSLANAIYDNPSLPSRQILLSVGPQNYRPPVGPLISKAKLATIEEEGDESGLPTVSSTSERDRARPRRASVDESLEEARRTFYWM